MKIDILVSQPTIHNRTGYGEYKYLCSTNQSITLSDALLSLSKKQGLGIICGPVFYGEHGRFCYDSQGNKILAMFDKTA